MVIARTGKAGVRFATETRTTRHVDCVPEESKGSCIMLEAICGKCGETFNPFDEDDTVHVETVSGRTCGGTGEIVREIPMGDASLMRMQTAALAEAWQNTGDARELYAVLQWSEVATLAGVLHAGGRPDVAASVVVWWLNANADDDSAPQAIAVLGVYETAAETL